MQELCKQNSLISLFIIQKDYKSQHSVQLPPLSVGWRGGGVELPTKFSKRGCLIGPQLSEPQLLKVTKNLVTFKKIDSVKDEKL